MNKQLQLQNKLIELGREMDENEDNASVYNELKLKYEALSLTRVVEYNITHTDSYMYRDAYGGYTIVRDETKPYSNN